MVIRDPWIRALVIVMLLIAAVYLVGMLWQVALQFADLILLFFLAWVISFMLEPLVAALRQRARLPRHLAVLSSYLVVLVAVSITIVQVTPRLTAQLIQVATDLPMYADWTNTELLRWQAFLSSQGIQIAPESLLTYQEIVRHVETVGPLLLLNTVGVASGLANLLFQVFIILILSYYMTLDGQRISRALLVALPRVYRDDARYFLLSVNRAFAGFIRGQVAQAAIYGVGTAAAMSIFGLKLVLLSSVAAGFFMFIPFVGPFLAIILPVAVAAVTMPHSVWPLFLTLFVLQQIVINVVAPRLLSHTVGLHPLLVFVAVLGGAKVAGVWGALFGVPVVAVISAMASFYYATEERQARLDDAEQHDPGSRPSSEPPVAVGGRPLAGPASIAAAPPVPDPRDAAPGPTRRPVAGNEPTYR